MKTEINKFLHVFIPQAEDTEVTKKFNRSMSSGEHCDQTSTSMLEKLH